MKFKAINDAVVVKTTKETHEVGGLITRAENNSIRYNLGEVIAASPKTVLVVGDRVYYDSVAGSVLRHEGDKYLVLKERDIALILD